MRRLKNVFLMMVMAAVACFAACSSDDEPSTASRDGKEFSEWIENNVFTNPTDITLYVDDNSESVYYGAVADSEAGRKFIGKMIGSDWNGKPLTFSVPDGYGSIKATPSDRDGLFYTVTVDVRGVKPFTLHLATKAYCESSNMRPVA